MKHSQIQYFVCLAGKGFKTDEPILTRFSQILYHVMGKRITIDKTIDRYNFNPDELKVCSLYFSMTDSLNHD